MLARPMWWLANLADRFARWVHWTWMTPEQRELQELFRNPVPPAGLALRATAIGLSLAGLAVSSIVVIAIVFGGLR